MKAVLFDVYETLLTGQRATNPNAVLQRVAEDFGVGSPIHLHDHLQQIIRQHHQRSSRPFPEVDIRECWREVLPRLDDLDAFALAAENAVHPVEAIRDAGTALKAVRDAGLLMGLVSNAQAYTWPILERHLAQESRWFDPELCSFSYQTRIAKPDPELFAMPLQKLAGLGIKPDEVLMVGDSFRNDIAPARSLGMQTHHLLTWEAFLSNRPFA